MKKLLLALLVLPIGMLAQDESKGLWQETMTSKVKLMKHSSRRADDKVKGAVAKLNYTQLPDMNTARLLHQIFASGSDLVVVGGMTTNSQMTPTAEIYENGQWKQIAINDSHAYGYSVVLNDGRIMIGGGYVANGMDYSKQTSFYNPATKTFTAGPDMTTGRIASRAIAVGGHVFVSGNWFGADSKFDRYNGTSFSAVGSTSGRSNPYMFSDNNGNVYTVSPTDANGNPFGYSTENGEQALSGDKYNAADGTSNKYKFVVFGTWMPIALTPDVRVSDYHYVKDGVNLYAVLTAGETLTGEGRYMLTEICPDKGEAYTYDAFNIPRIHPVTNATITYRGGVFVNQAKQEYYLIGTSGEYNNQVLHIISFNYETGNWSIASASGFTHDLKNASWTMLPDGRLVCSGGNGTLSGDVRSNVYIFTPVEAGSEETEDPTPTTGESRVIIWLKTGEKVGYELADAPIITFLGSKLVIQTNKVTIPYERKDVLRYTFENIKETGIDLTPGERRVEINRDGDEIIFRGLQTGVMASIYAVNGTLIEQHKVTDSQPLTISLKNRPIGVYIVKAGTETIKVMKR